MLPWKLVRDYKNKIVDKTEYREIYYSQVLSLIDPQNIYDTLKGKVLLCWEKKGSFCHRHLVLEWLEEQLGEETIGGEL